MTLVEILSWFVFPALAALAILYFYFVLIPKAFGVEKDKKDKTVPTFSAKDQWLLEYLKDYKERVKQGTATQEDHLQAQIELGIWIEDR